MTASIPLGSLYPQRRKTDMQKNGLVRKLANSITKFSAPKCLRKIFSSTGKSGSRIVKPKKYEKRNGKWTGAKSPAARKRQPTLAILSDEAFRKQAEICAESIASSKTKTNQAKSTRPKGRTIWITKKRK